MRRLTFLEKFLLRPAELVPPVLNPVAETIDARNLRPLSCNPKGPAGFKGHLSATKPKPHQSLVGFLESQL
jgi:hypothetical protein